MNLEMTLASSTPSVAFDGWLKTILKLQAVGIYHMFEYTGGDKIRCCRSLFVLLFSTLVCFFFLALPLLIKKGWTLATGGGSCTAVQHQVV